MGDRLRQDGLVFPRNRSACRLCACASFRLAGQWSWPFGLLLPRVMQCFAAVGQRAHAAAPRYSVVGGQSAHAAVSLYSVEGGQEAHAAFPRYSVAVMADPRKK